jgi:hypothetical protein
MGLTRGGRVVIFLNACVGYSGDLFTRDEEGFLYYKGIQSEMSKTKGEGATANGARRER